MRCIFRDLIHGKSLLHSLETDCCINKQSFFVKTQYLMFAIKLHYYNISKTYLSNFVLWDYMH